MEKEACEHDASDSAHVLDLITHEMIHVYHGQNYPHPDFAGMDQMGWFPEGLATYASGQLAGRHFGRAREAIDSGAAPTELESAWSGSYRYGVAGSLVKFIDVTFGRAMINRLLSTTSEEEILAALDLTEAELLNNWREFVLDEDK